MRTGRVLLLICVTLSILSCGGGSVSTDQPPAKLSLQFDHVFVLVAENQSFSKVVGNPSMPFLNSLISKYALATNYFANMHNSLPNYFELTTGDTIATDDLFAGTVTQNNVVRALTTAGKSWKCYAENLPSAGYLGATVFPYAKDHIPFAYFSDVLNNSSQASNLVGLGQLSADITSGQFAAYSFIVPNQINNTHDCPSGGSNCTNTQKLGMLDQWLQAQVTPLLSSTVFQQNSVLIITFDEGDISDVAHGGGQVATVVIGSRVRPGYRSTTFYQHQSTLRFTLEALGVKDLPGASASAPAT